MYISITVSPKSQHKRPVSTTSTRTQCTKTVTYTSSMIVAFPSYENRTFHTSAYTRRNTVLPARELHCAQVAWCDELIRMVIRVEFGWLLAQVVSHAVTWFVFVFYWRDSTEPRNNVGEIINIHKPSPNFTIIGIIPKWLVDYCFTTFYPQLQKVVFRALLITKGLWQIVEVVTFGSKRCQGTRANATYLGYELQSEMDSSFRWAFHGISWHFLWFPQPCQV